MVLFIVVKDHAKSFTTPLADPDYKQKIINHILLLMVLASLRGVERLKEERDKVKKILNGEV